MRPCRAPHSWRPSSHRWSPSPAGMAVPWTWCVCFWCGPFVVVTHAPPFTHHSRQGIRAGTRLTLHRCLASHVVFSSVSASTLPLFCSLAVPLWLSFLATDAPTPTPAAECVFGYGLLYLFRVFERQRGSPKFMVRSCHSWLACQHRHAHLPHTARSMYSRRRASPPPWRWWPPACCCPAQCTYVPRHFAAPPPRAHAWLHTGVRVRPLRRPVRVAAPLLVRRAARRPVHGAGPTTDRQGVHLRRGGATVHLQGVEQRRRVRLRPGSRPAGRSIWAGR